MPTIAERRAAYASEYKSRFAAAKIDAEHRDEVLSVARRILAVRPKYEPIVKATGVPWWLVGIMHYRESDLRFDRHLHNGDALTARTWQVPAGRPAAGSPPYTFTESAVDALTMPGKQYHLVKTWDVVEVLLRLEQYNGFGYRGKGIPSPYLWAMTNQSNERGKYVRDGVFDANAPDRQVGCVAVMLALRELGVDLFAASAAPPPPDIEPTEPVKPKPTVAEAAAAKPGTTATGAVSIAVAGGAVVAANHAGVQSHNATGFLIAAGVAVLFAVVAVVIIARHRSGGSK